MNGRRRWILALLGVLLVGWLATGVFAVESNERAVVLVFGRVVGEAEPGLGWAPPWPIGEVRRAPVTEVRRLEVGFRSQGELYTEARRSDMLTGDENILKVMMVVQYRIIDARDYLLNAVEPDWLVERAVESALTRHVAGMQVDDLLTTAKAAIELRSIEAAQAELDLYGVGIRLLGGNLQTVSPPVPVLEAFNDVTRAKKDNERLVEDARSYANEILPEARAEANEQVEQARAAADTRVRQARGEARRFDNLREEFERAPELTRRRLYLEMLERVFDGAEVLVLEEGTRLNRIGRPGS